MVQQIVLEFVDWLNARTSGRFTLDEFHRRFYVYSFGEGATTSWLIIDAVHPKGEKYLRNANGVWSHGERNKL